jgi:hypothetical protein
VRNEEQANDLQQDVDSGCMESTAAGDNSWPQLAANRQADDLTDDLGYWLDRCPAELPSAIRAAIVAMICAAKDE